MKYPRSIWIVRHAEREDNINKNWKKLPEAQGLSQDNSHLSRRGRSQAAECATRFANVPLNHVFASPFDRTIQTASIIAQGKGLLVKPEPGLLEAFYLCDKPPSYWSAEELKTKYELVDTDYIPLFTKHILPKEGFGDEACVPRLRATIQYITAKYEGDLLLVGHGASIGACHEVLCNDFRYVGQATVSKFTETSPGNFKLDYSGDSSHLSDKSNLRPW